MLIQCTKKLLDQLNIKPVEHPEEDPLFSWHANLITLNRRKTVVLVNDKNRYVIVLHGLKAKEFKSLDQLILQGIRKTFQEECIKTEIIDQYMDHSKEIIYTKTKDRTSVARMNKACETLYYYEELLDSGSLFQTDLSKRASHYLVGDGPKKYITPSEELYKDLKAFAGRDIFGCRAVELKVSLDLDKHQIWRKIVVPLNITFNKLHKVLQAAFGWKDYHLHDFFIYGNEILQMPFDLINHPGYHKERYKSVVNLVTDEDAFEYENDIPTKFEKGIKLFEYIPDYKRLKYNYDFGDNWQHYIEIERTIEDYDKNYAVCLEGEGNTPPEDVGGEHGYEEFLEILVDKGHPDHEGMVAWGRSQGYEEFELEKVNQTIRFLFR